MVLFGVLLILVGAGRGRARQAAVEPPAPEIEAERLKGNLFGKELPIDPGPTVTGLYGASAQVCAACHPATTADWADSAHARPPSAELVDAATGLPQCLGCHLPLVAQSEAAVSNSGETSPNPAFDATLQIEGVTCAACHQREGKVIAGSARAAARPSPHPMVWSADLGSSDACAACHQLAWPGAADPLYDTWGEWKRSGLEAIGIGCQGCHLRAGADGGPLDHRMVADPARAVTVQLATPTTRVVRGGAPVVATVGLANTGAGHSFPTGSPFRGIRLAAVLRGPAEAAPIEVLTVDLARDLDPTPPFAVRADTRLGVGEGRRWELPLAVPIDAPAGEWALELTLRRTVRGKPVGEPFVNRRWNIRVE